MNALVLVWSMLNLNIGNASWYDQANFALKVRMRPFSPITRLPSANASFYDSFYQIK